MSAGIAARFAARWPSVLHLVRPIMGLAMAGMVLAQPAAVVRPAVFDNAALLPPLDPDGEVTLEGTSPDWVKSLILAELRLETSTEKGTFAAATPVLDHYARLGVNGLWITPIFERGSAGNGYSNFGPHTVEPLLADGKRGDEAFTEVRRFVDEAHRRRIRVLFDIVVWGTLKQAPLVTGHPEFYAKKSDGSFSEVWGGYAFDWHSEALRGWFEQAAVDFIGKTGADGFRVDLAPDTSGDFFGRIRQRLAAQGRKIVIVSEMPNERRDVFDFEQSGVTGWTEPPDWAHPDRLRAQKERFGLRHEFFLRHDIVDAIRDGRGIGHAGLQQRGMGGTFRHYTANLLCHDDAMPAAQGNRVRFAYGTLFAPFLPMWWIGEEWNNPRQALPGPGGTGVMYFNRIDWAAAAREPHASFLRDVAAFIRIRRSHPDIFEHFAASTRDANIAKVTSRLNGQPNPLRAYARTSPQKAILVVPNLTGRDSTAEVDLTPGTWGLGGTEIGRWSVFDLRTGRALDTQGGRFRQTVKAEDLGVFLIGQKR